MLDFIAGVVDTFVTGHAHIAMIEISVPVPNEGYLLVDIAGFARRNVAVSSALLLKLKGGRMVCWLC